MDKKNALCVLRVSGESIAEASPDYVSLLTHALITIKEMLQEKMLELNLPRQFNAAEYFVDRNVAEGRGDKTAILFEDQAVTYDQLMENVNRVASVLTELGVGMEERVMLLVRDTPEMLY